MRITVKPLREEALKAGFASLLDRLPHGYSFDEFKGNLANWDVQAFCDGEYVVGMLMKKGPELHVAVIPQVRGRWLSRRLIREVFTPILSEYGEAVAAILPDNDTGREFTARLGFAGDVNHLRIGFETLRFDPVTALIGGAVGLGTALIGGHAAKSAAETQAAAANQATDTQLQMFNTQNAQQEPYRQAGYSALNEIAQLQPQFTHSFDASDLNANMAPNYAFELAQGQGAAKNALNVMGGTGGNFAKGLVDYTTNKAADAYQNAFNNYQTNQTNIFNRLSNVAGLGQTANANTGALAGQTAQGVAQTQVGAGAASAAGTIGQANALTGGANNALGWYALSKLGTP